MRKGRDMESSARLLVWMFALVAAVFAPAGSAGSVTYDYDALGRLIQVENPSLNSVQAYVYDAAGNITATPITPMSSLSVGGLSSSQAPAGGQITIYGSGFSTVPGSNTVTINGTTATVVSATATQLIVHIPTGATSGLISVTTGGVTVNSAGTFTVTPALAAPTIASFSPVLGAAGAALTITGSNFDPNPANNKIQFGGGTWTSANTRTSTTIGTVVPPTAAWGKLHVLTPQGLAVSTADFFSPPKGYAVSAIASTGRLLPGAPAALNFAGTSGSSMQVFDGNAGDLLTIGVTNDTVANLTLKIFGPDGSLLTSGAVTASGQGLQLPPLQRTGTYALVADPGNASGAATITLGAPVQGTLTLGGAAQAVNLSIPGQRALLTFAGTQGAYVSVALTSVTLSAARISIIASDGSRVISNTFGTVGLTVSPQLPVTGTYTVLIDPSGAISGSLNVGATSSPTPTLAINGATNVTTSDTKPVPLTFRGTAGQYLSLGVSEPGSSGSTIQGASITVLTPDGTQLTSGTFTATCGFTGCSWSGSTVVNMGPLPTSGTYTILIQQTSLRSGTLSVVLSAPATAALTANGTVTSVGVTNGQSMQLTFAGTTGQYLALGVSEPGSSGSSIQGANITVLNPNGTQLKTGTLTATCGFTGCFWSGNTVINLGPLPANGTYTVVIQQTTESSGALGIVLSVPAIATLTANGTSTSVSVANGQSMQLTFAGTAGQYLSLGVSEPGSSGSSIQGANITVLKPDGTQLTTGTLTATCGFTGCFWSGNTIVNMGPLPTSGTYTVLIQQTTESSGALSMVLSASATAALTANGTATSVSVANGQSMQLTFAGTAGQYLSLGVSEPGSSGSSIQGANIIVLKPDGTQLTTGTFTATCGFTGCFWSGNTVVSIGPLPMSGNYTVLIQQKTESSGALGIALSNPATATLASNGTVTSVSVTNGQSMQLTFASAAGQYLSLGVSEPGSSGSSIQGASITVLKPDGTQLTTGTFTATCGFTGCFWSGNTLINMGPLPAVGTYTVLIQQTTESSGALSINLSGPATGTLAANGTATPVSATNGQSMQLTFAGSAGQFLALGVSEPGSSSSTIQGASITVLRPDGTQLTTGTLTATCGFTGCFWSGNALVNMGPLPVAGTYTVLVQQTTRASGALSIVLSNPTTGTLAANGTTTSISVTNGQSMQLAFAGNAGQFLALGVSEPGSSSSTIQGASIIVFNPDGTQLKTGAFTATCGFTGCFWSGNTLVNMGPLPSTGTYTVLIQQTTQSSGALSMTLSVPATGTLAANGTVTSVSVANGQSMQLTFAGNAGQYRSLAVSEPGSSSSTIQGASITVLNPDGTQLTTGTLTATCGFTGCFWSGSALVNMGPLPATGTYTVLIQQTVRASGALSIALSTPGIATLTANGAVTPISVTNGQSLQPTFVGTAGQYLSLAVSEPGSSSSTIQGANITVLNPDGTALKTGTFTATCGFTGCTWTGSALINMGPLPSSGTYSVLIQQTTATSGALSLTLSAPATSTLAANGAATSVSVANGQSMQPTFVGTAGQYLSLAVSEPGSPSSTMQGASITVLNPDGTPLKTGTLTATCGFTGCTWTGNTLINIGPLPANGTYGVLIQQTTAASGALSLILSAPATGTLTANAVATSISIANGQSMQLTFTSTAGQYLSLSIVEPGSAGSTIQGANIIALNPDGTQLTTGTFTATCGFTGCTWTGSTAVNIGPLPLSGTYTVLIQQTTPASGALTLSLH
jgi:YD repeat-containing protein